MMEKAKRIGRPKFEVTAQRRALVVRLVAAGGDAEIVAKTLGCSVKTLHGYFADELRQGVSETTARIGFRVIAAAEAGDLRAAELYLRTKGRWSERIAVDFEPEDAELFAAYKNLSAEFLEFMRLAIQAVDVRDPASLAIEFLNMLVPADRNRAIAHFLTPKPKGIENAQTAD